MQSVGQRGDSKGFVKFLEKNHLIVAGHSNKTTFYINKDGSSSLGGGVDGMSFFCLNDTPEKPDDKKILGIAGEKIGYIDQVDVKSVEADEVKSKALVAFTSSLENIISSKIHSNDVIADTIHVTKHLDAELINAEEAIIKELSAPNLKVNNIFSIDSAHLADVEILGKLSVPTIELGKDVPLQICKAENYKFQMKDAKKLVLHGRHFNDKLEFQVHSELPNLFDHVISVDVLDLLGEETSVIGKMIKKLDDSSFMVRLTFNKKLDDKKDKLEKVSVSLV